MNKKLITMLGLTMGLGLSCVAADQVKVCVYDPEAVMSQSKELGSLMAEVDKKFQKSFETLQKEEESLRKDAETFQAKVSVMSQEAREVEAKALGRRQREFEAKRNELAQDYNEERQKVVGVRFLKKLEEGVSEFAQANAYDLVLPKGPGVFALARADQTASLVAHMNKKFDATTKNTLKTAPVTVAKNTAVKK